MMISPEDPQLTAYALGELSDADIRETEEALAQSEELRQALRCIQSSIMVVREVSRQSLRSLTSNRRQAIEDRLNTESPITESIAHRRYNWNWHLRVAAIALLLLSVVWLTWSSKRIDVARIQYASAEALISRIHRALERYQSETGTLPQDTGYGLSPVDSSRGAGRTYDSGSLWRYLSNSRRIGDKTYGPYLTFTSAELVSYKDPIHGDSFFVVDPWGTPIGYIGDQRRVIHNIGRFDIFSAGPDRKTGQDLRFSKSAENLAYDGIDNDGDGVVDNASELGSAALNGCLTFANAGAMPAGVELDDLNNWDGTP